MKSDTKKEKNKIFTIPKILMLVGALWVIIYGILTLTKVTDGNFYGWKTSWQGLVLIGVLYILIPFSTKSGWWSRIWFIFLAGLSIIIVIGNFVGVGVDYQSIWTQIFSLDFLKSHSSTVNYQSIWTYLNPLPHILIAIGAIFGIIRG